MELYIWFRLDLFEFVLTKGDLMKPRNIRTPQEVRDDFIRKGISMASWAKKNGFSPVTVFQVLNGTNAGTRGVGHKIAVTLGIKKGEIVGD
jgi:gp16 family phage-associated protein